MNAYSKNQTEYLQPILRTKLRLEFIFFFTRLVPDLLYVLSGCPCKCS